MENFTLEELVSQNQIINPEEGIIVNGFACYPEVDSFCLTDSKPGDEIHYLIKCSIKNSIISDSKTDILTYSKLYHNENANKLIKPIEIHAMGFRPPNNGSGRLFPQLQKVIKIEIKDYE